MSTDPGKDKNYRETLNLPQTEFPMKADLAKREPVQLIRWEKEKIYEQILQKNSKRPIFTLHDGPPYANGSIHFGHILNKVLKDIVVKYKNLAGYRSEFIPGWDCHGLPIEHQVEKELQEKEIPHDRLKVRKSCRDFAQGFVNTQKEEFKRLGIFAQWDKSYQTMDPKFEATIARQLAQMARKGLLYRGSKPVHWSTACQTALAEAEIEYTEHLSPSIYVKFQAVDDWAELNPLLAGKIIQILIWTTTPWTLPANQALAVNGNYTYVAVEVGEEIFLLAEALLDSLRNTLNFQEDRLIDRIPGKKLAGLRVRHPFLDRQVPIVLGTHVTLDTGTGIVHIAPGHGQEDYELGLKNKLPPLSPVDAQGNFTKECGVPDWVGKNVFKANELIIRRLRKNHALLKLEEIKHSYPYCWRSKTPLIFRSTPQYFLSMEPLDLRGKALDGIRRTEWIPSWGRDRIYNMVEARPDWCLSRQRVWGLPLMAFHCNQCQAILLDGNVMEHLAKRFEREGSDSYFQYDEKDLLPPGLKCPQCRESSFTKETDILDVWFESGSSWAAIIESQRDQNFPADLYLEGSDQHRGWFQSSLLVSTATRGEPPYRSVLTHGFVVDGDGKKYSKSAKNYHPPEKLLKEVGADVLRLWVAAEDYRQDIRFSEEILERVKETYRKIRNTSRFMLGNLFDFNPDSHWVSEIERQILDRWALDALAILINKLKKHYDTYEFHLIYLEINHFFTVTLSAFYLDILKDRLYVSAANSPERLAAQSTLFDILKNLLPYLSPVLSFTAEEIFTYLPNWETKPSSVFLMDLSPAQEIWEDKTLREHFEKIQSVRSEVTQALEKARKQKKIHHSLGAQVRIQAEGELQKFLQDQIRVLPSYFIVSQIVVVYELSDPIWKSEKFKNLQIEILPAEGEKCGRCWKYSITVGRQEKYPTLCEPCIRVLS